MPMPNLSSASIDALLKLRDEVEKALSRRAKELQDQLSRLGRAPGLRGRFTTGDLDQCNTFARIGYRMIGQEGLPKRTYRTLVFFPVFGGVCLLTPNPKAVKRLPGSFSVGGA